MPSAAAKLRRAAAESEKQRRDTDADADAAALAKAIAVHGTERSDANGEVASDSGDEDHPVVSPEEADRVLESHFFGAVVEPGKSETLSLFGVNLHVTQIALDSSDKGDKALARVTVESADTPTPVLLATLSARGCPQALTDICFWEEDESVTFYNHGNAAVHLTGASSSRP